MARIKYYDPESGDWKCADQASSSGSSQNADLSQNDPTQPDYIKNRTHWVEGEQTVIEWDTNGEYTIDGRFIKISDYAPTKEQMIGSTLEVVYDDGFIDKFEITEDNITNGPFNEGEGYFCVFLAVCFSTPEGAPFSSAGVYYVLQEGIQRISISIGTLTYHTISESYIPDTIARTSDIPEIPEPDVLFVTVTEGETVLHLGEYYYAALSNASNYLTEGAIYIVTFNGTEYECMAKPTLYGNFLGNGIFYGDGNRGNEEPFSYNDEGELTVEEPGVYTISIVGVDGTEILAETTVTVEAVNRGTQYSIKNATADYTAEQIRTARANGRLVQVYLRDSGYFVPLQWEIGGEFYFWVYDNNGCLSISVDDENNWEVCLYDLYSSNTLMFCDSERQPKGIVVGDGLEIQTNEFGQPVAIKAAPTLPMPATASVGQFIMVSTVDENGKVTATEAVDAPTLPNAEEVAF